MSRYFKDQKLLLIFYHRPEGIPLEDISELCSDARTGKSLVIAARGARKYKNEEIGGAKSAEANGMRDLFHAIQLDIRFNDGAMAKTVQLEHPDTYASVMSWAAGHTTDRLVLLAFDDGDPLPEYPNGDLVAIRRGGVELVSEFLLSRFASVGARPACEFLRLDGAALTAEEVSALRDVGHEDIDLGLYRVNWTYDFALNDHFFELCDSYDEEFDDEVPFFETHERAIHNINQDALAQMHRWIEVPYELRKILSPDQDRKWREELIPKIIGEHLDFIGIDLFGLQLASYGADRAAQYAQAAGAAWDEDMREYLTEDD